MQKKKTNTLPMMILYLLGLFMGALDTGIVSPARTVIQSQLGVSDATGIWMITIFTLAYASSIPISGKLADRYGRKKMYMISILLFGLGSLLCALSPELGGFPALLVGRVIQAFGGGGIMPIVTAEIGTAFPPEKRGIALGMVGGVYGIANILGSSAGSLILDIAGQTGWGWLFFINVPITVLILVGSFFFLENHTVERRTKLDFIGITVMVMMVLSLMYGLNNLKFHDFVHSLTSTAVYPFLVAFFLLLPVFVYVEKRASDPIIQLKYFKNRNIVITLIASVVAGVSMMGMIFVPQFAENILKIKLGAGGYFVTLLGVFAGVAAPLSGKMVDKYGAKIVLIIGFLFSLTGSLQLALITTQFMNVFNVLIGLGLIGLGMGFTMGTPLNYMMLSEVSDDESTGALATLSLVRSIGTTISPNLMIGFIATAGAGMMNKLRAVLPSPKPVQIEGIQAIQTGIDKLKEIPQAADMLSKMNIPDFSTVTSTQMPDLSTMSSYVNLPADVMASLQSADVTTITDRLSNFMDQLLKQIFPEIVTKIQDGIEKGISGLQSGIDGISGAIAKMGTYGGETLDQLKAQQAQLQDLAGQMQAVLPRVQVAFDQSRSDYLVQIGNMKPILETTFQQGMNDGFKGMFLTVAAVAAFGVLVLLFYKKKQVLKP